MWQETKRYKFKVMSWQMLRSFFSLQAGKGLFYPDEWHAQKALNPIKRQKFIRIVIL